MDLTALNCIKKSDLFFRFLILFNIKQKNTLPNVVLFVPIIW